MRKFVNSSLAGLLCGLMALTSTPSPSRAGVLPVPGASTLQLASNVEQVRFRRHVRHRHHYRRHRRRYGYNPGAAIFGALAAGLLSGGYYDYPDYSYGYGPYWGGGGGYGGYGGGFRGGHGGFRGGHGGGGRGGGGHGGRHH